MADSRKYFLRLEGAEEGLYSGRKEETEQLSGLLADPAITTLVLHGAEGVGKSSLALEASRASTGHFDYIYAFNAHGGLHIEEVFYRLCQFFSHHNVGSFENILLGPIPLELKTAFLARILQKVRLLLVFDGFESMIDESERLIDTNMATVLSELIKNCGPGGAKFLFISSMDFSPAPAAEEARVTHLPLGNLTREGSLELLGKLPALEALTPEVKEIIYRKTGGHPLGLCMLGRLGRYTSITEALDKVSDATAVEDIVALCFEALPGSDKTVLPGAASFHKAVPEVALSWHTGSKVEDAVLERLLGLRLLTRVGSGEAAQYLSHVLVRDCLQLKIGVREWRAALVSGGGFLEKYSLETGSLWHMLSAYALYKEAGDMDRMCKASTFVLASLKGWGFTLLADRLAGEALGCTAGVPRAKALMHLGNVAAEAGDMEGSITKFAEALDLFKAEGQREEHIAALERLATARMNRGEMEEALRLFESALPILEGTTKPETRASLISKAGIARHALGRMPEAERDIREAVSIAEGTGDKKAEAYYLGELGAVLKDMGKAEAALESFRKSLLIKETLKESRGMAYTLVQIGEMELALDKPAEAVANLKKALALAEHTSDKRAAALGLTHMGRALVKLGDMKGAIKNLIIGLALLESTGTKDRELATGALAEIEASLGQEEFKRINDEAMKELKGFGGGGGGGGGQAQ